MRILFTVDPEIPVPPTTYGGIERIVDGLINELRQRGHTIGLNANPDSTCPVDLFNPWPGGKSSRVSHTLLNTAALMRTVRQFHPDILHSFSRLGYLLPLLPTRLPKVMSYQRHTGGLRNRIAARVSGKSLIFTACSEFIAQQGRPWGGDWMAIPNFSDTTFFQASLRIAVDAPLLFLSRVERIKGAHTAIEIAQQAGRILIIAGNKVESGEGALYWANKIAPHIDGRQIKYVGPVNNEQKRDLLSEAAALVVPVQWGEPFGIVFVEALACGTPVISCPRGALPEIIEHSRHGFLVNSVAEGVEAVRHVGTISRQVCRARAEERFSQHVVASQYESLYERILSRK